jgi:hypothetical protein
MQSCKTLSAKLLLITTLVCLPACGEEEPSTKGENEFSEVTNNIEENSSTGSSDQGPGITFRGYVAGAFELTVDSVKYQDMEDFYTQELTRLPGRVYAAGYDESYDVTLAAEVGLSDLWHHMTVYMAPVEQRGYQGEAKVEKGGEFSISLPIDATSASYQVRANKRIAVLLRQGSEQISICYNFLALDKSVLFDEKEKPIILDKFETRITKYACDAEAESGLEIPAPPKARDPYTGVRLEKGMSKQEVLGILGEDNLSINPYGTWCYGESGLDNIRQCEEQYKSSCSCSVSFDDAGLLDYQDNINTEYLDVFSW